MSHAFFWLCISNDERLLLGACVSEVLSTLVNLGITPAAGLGRLDSPGFHTSSTNVAMIIDVYSTSIWLSTRSHGNFFFQNASIDSILDSRLTETCFPRPRVLLESERDHWRNGRVKGVNQELIFNKSKVRGHTLIGEGSDSESGMDTDPLSRDEEKD